MFNPIQFIIDEVRTGVTRNQNIEDQKTAVDYRDFLQKTPNTEVDPRDFQRVENFNAALPELEKVKTKAYTDQAAPYIKQVQDFQTDPRWKDAASIGEVAKNPIEAVFGSNRPASGQNPTLDANILNFVKDSQLQDDLIKAYTDPAAAARVAMSKNAAEYRDTTQGIQNLTAADASRNTVKNTNDKLARERLALATYNNEPVTVDPANMEAFKGKVRSAGGTYDITEKLIEDFEKKNNPYANMGEAELTMKAINGDAKAQAVLDRMQGRKVETSLASKPPGMPRPGRMYQVVDTMNGNTPVYIESGELSAANKAEPGRYLAAGPAQKALQQTNLIEDIRGNIGDVREALKGMPEFTSTQAGRFSVAMNDRNPETAVRAFLTSKVGQTLDPAQQTYLIRLAQLNENAMAMRSVLGAGQGSDDVRKAIRMTIPNPATPTSAYAMEQLQRFEVTLDRLSRGVLKVPLREQGKGGQPGAKGEGLNLDMSAIDAAIAKKRGK